MGAVSGNINYAASSIRRLFRMLSADKREIYYIYVYAILGGIISLILPLGVQAIIGIISSQQVSTSWGILVFLILAGIVFSGVLKILQQNIIETLRQKIFARAAFEFIYRIPRFKMDLLHKYYPPELINRFFDVMNIQKGIEKLLIEFTTSSVQIFFSLLVLAFYHPLFLLFGVVLVGILYLIFRFSFLGGLKAGMEASHYKYETAAWIEEVARTMGTFKLSGRDALAMEEMNHHVSRYIDARKRFYQVMKTFFRSEIAFKAIIVACLLILGSLLVIDKQINIGQFVAAELIVLSLAGAVEKAIYSMDTVYDTLVALEKIGYVTDIPVEEPGGITLQKESSTKGLEVQVYQVSYQFPGRTGFAIRDISFDVKAGENVAITGLNGSGKSTLIDLICGFYGNYEGDISINRIPLRNIDAPSLRMLIGDNLSQQDVFRATLLQNLTMNKEGIGMDKVIELCDRFHLTAFIQSLPEGFETIMDPEGRKFPRNILSKIILVRSLLKEPGLVLLDDFITTLEREEKSEIAAWLFSPDKPWSVIVSTNDELLLKHCDKIVWIEDGAVRKTMTWQEASSDQAFKTIYS
jgi:ABC-type bacteriocin/lantibiotic exporter with double-glycine peptidase domain